MQRGPTLVRACFGALLVLFVLAPAARSDDGGAASEDKKVFYDVRATPAAQKVLRERAARL